MKKLIAAILSALCLIAIVATPTVKLSTPTLKIGYGAFNDLNTRGSITNQ